MYRHTRPVPPEWQADLDRLNPEGEHMTKLVLHWYAGIEYEPVQRWAIWEVIPKAMWSEILAQEQIHGVPQEESLTYEMLTELRGPDPRSAGEWVDCKCGAEEVCHHPGALRWLSESTVSRAQWEIHKETGGIPRLTWIIQGDKGGHAWQWGPNEYAWLLSTGITHEQASQLCRAIPNPGELPYAPYDQRVYDALAKRDKLREWRQNISWQERTGRTRAGLWVGKDRGAAQVEFNRVMLKFLEDQIESAISDIPRSMLPQWSELETTDQAPDLDESAETFIKRV